MVVEGRLSRGGVRVEQAALAAGRHRHADRVPDTLAERTGRGLDAGGVAVLRVPGVLLPQVRSALRSSAPAPSRRGRAGCRGSGSSGRRRARTGPGRASAGRPGCAASPSGTAGRPPGARLIAVPGCPLPTFCTASIASTRMVSTALSSSSVHSRVAKLSVDGWRVGHGSSPFMRLSAGVAEPTHPRALDSTQPGHPPRPARTPVTYVGQSAPAPAPPCGRHAGDRRHPAGRPHGVRRAHQAARDRAAAADHRPGHVLRGRRVRRSGWSWRRSSAAPCRRARPRR